MFSCFLSLWVPLGAKMVAFGASWRQLCAALGPKMLAFGASWRQEGHFWTQDGALLDRLSARIAFFLARLLAKLLQDGAKVDQDSPQETTLANLGHVSSQLPKWI